jgi:Fe-S-cluster-containing hydrogenase component 2
MIANYGYQDGSGEYYITIDTGKCIDCEGRWCVAACPQSMFEVEIDDWDDEVATIVAVFRKQLRERCSVCKPAGGYESLPCTTACLPEAISHSW